MRSRNRSRSVTARPHDGRDHRRGRPFGLGGPGNDTADGGDGNDTLFGNFQSDVLIGGPGDDFMNGDNPNDPGQEPPPGAPTETPGATDSCFGGSGFNVIVNCETGDPNTPLPAEV